MKSTAVGMDDLACHGQSEAVGGVRQGIQVVQDFFGNALSVVLNRDGDIFRLQAAGNGDQAALFIVADAVVQQVVKRSGEERLVAEDCRLSAV